MPAEPVQRNAFGLVGTILDGRFRIDREVAEGGFGVVYHATQIALDRPVAIKVLKTPSGFDEAAKIQFRDRFASEAKTIARIRHTHIVDVYDFGVSTMPSGDIAPWMALEWLAGETLEDQLQRRRGRGGQSPTEVLSFFRPILGAFAFAHKQGIVHRDIKPANIMAVPTDGAPLMRVLDFGIAKLVNPDEAAGSGHTKTSGIPAFSPLYAAPEQIAFGRTGPWTDVHALGLILTELLTDQPPYRADDMQLFEEIISPTRPTPGSRGIDVGEWEPVLRKAVALSPGERWRSASELLAALDASPSRAAEVRGKPAAASVGPTPAASEAAPAAGLRVTGETAMEIAGMRAASRGRRGRLVAGGVVVLLCVVGATVALTRTGDKSGPGTDLRASTAPVAPPANVPPAPPPPAAAAPPVEPSVPAKTAAAIREPAPPPATEPAGKPARAAKPHPKPVRRPGAAHRKDDEIEIE